ncbi:MAG: ABC transporter ATP-binding protein [Lachnospiraceae bacterium]|nr:ABC transporter ATP-binding protein [Lachnospiraceae bacterium]
MNNYTKQKNPFKSRIGTLLFFLKGSKRYFLLSIFLTTLVSLFDLLNPRLIGAAIDFLTGEARDINNPLYLRFFTYLASLKNTPLILSRIALLVALTALLAAVFRYLSQLTDSIGAEGFVKRMRDVLFSHIIRLPYDWHNKNATGDIIQRCTSDVDTIKVFLSEQLNSLLRIIVLMTLSLYFMSGIHKPLTLITAATIPVIIFYSSYFHTKIGAAFRRADEEEGRVSAIVQENLTGIRVVRAFGKEGFEKERFEKKNEAYTRMWVHLMQLGAVFWAANDLIAGLKNITVVAFGAYFCVKGGLSAGDYVAFIAYSAMLDWPVRSLGRVISEMSKAGISIDRVRYIMDCPVESDPSDCVRPPLDRDICFENVSFAYDGTDKKVLDNVSLTVKAGSTVGIIGSTGCGKTTLMYLLDKLYDLKEGEGRITVGGIDIALIQSGYLRDNIGLVLQEPYLFSRTLKENIAITKDIPDMKETKKAVSIASLDETITHFNKGYDTFVGERGVTLSGGQKQRTAIAQMLIKHPPIMIFDDSLSAVDAKTDIKIRKALAEYTGNATVFLISHRVKTLMNADLIIVMDNGRIAQSGTHSELIAKEGVYRVLCELQGVIAADRGLKEALL